MQILIDSMQDVVGIYKALLERYNSKGLKSESGIIWASDVVSVSKTFIINSSST